ncbi:MAG TPA: sodium:solute symporter [Bryobacteraceae bacterium]|nr:sodium:solute symporter [Bryobacteraceae bacterium]
MSAIDWSVLVLTLGAILGYGLWRARGSSTTQQYLLAGKEMPWYAMALSIMATQASAVTFISTTGQAYVDGMRFVQFYFGLPIAMILIAETAVPIFHRSGVYTAYEYLEKRFDVKTRLLISLIFLVSRGLAVGVTLSAPAIVLSVILGISDTWTVIIMGAIITLFATFGGIKAITWTDTQQMLIMLVGIATACLCAIWQTPVGFWDQLTLAGAAGRLNPVTFNFDWDDRFNFWSGLVGGTFLALAYFGCDQSQVQRYLTGKSITQSRLSLLFNAVAKIPMQFGILFTGAMVYVFFIYTQPPANFRSATPGGIEYEQSHKARQAAADAVLQGNTSPADFKNRQKEFDTTRQTAPGGTDTNYIFLYFVTHYLPIGVAGLALAVVFGAALTTSSGELNSLATVSVIDIYKRYFNANATDGQYLLVSRLGTVFWGIYAIASAQYAKTLGSLIEVVNMLGSLFYGGLLGVFILAFYFPRVKGNAAFVAVLLGEAVIFSCKFSTSLAFLWYNVIGSLVVVFAGLLLSTLQRDVPNPADS